MFVGMVMLIYSMWLMTGWTPDVSQRDVIIAILLQGFGLGLVFVPLQVLAFWSLPVEHRTDGTALLSLFRNVGSAIGISVMSTALAQNTQVLHHDIAAAVTPFNRALQAGGPMMLYWSTAPMPNPLTPDVPAPNPLVDPAHGKAALDRMVNRQAEIIAYVDDFKLMMLTSLPALLLLLLLRRPARAAVPPDPAHAAMD
jgi:DHA2 family multidrug resistance protein